MEELCMLFMIINADDENKFLKILNKYQPGFKVVMHGTGTASSSLLEYFGLSETNKTIITSVLPPIICKYILTEINQKINVNEPGSGIAFSISLSSSTKYMTDYYKNYEMEDLDMNKANQHLIITITNEGFAEQVMSAAKKGGGNGWNHHKWPWFRK